MLIEKWRFGALSVSVDEKTVLRETVRSDFRRDFLDRNGIPNRQNVKNIAGDQIIHMGSLYLSVYILSYFSPNKNKTVET